MYFSNINPCIIYELKDNITKLMTIYGSYKPNSLSLFFLTYLFYTWMKCNLNCWNLSILREKCTAALSHSRHAKLSGIVPITSTSFTVLVILYAVRNICCCFCNHLHFSLCFKRREKRQCFDPRTSDEGEWLRYRVDARNYSK